MRRCWLWVMPMIIASMSATAEEITYRTHIRPLWEQKCSRCHDDRAPYFGDFMQDRKTYENDDKGPRMDSYADMLFFVTRPETGSLMNRLDDGKNRKNHRPGNMYKRLGKNESERQKNLALFKAWIGEEGWAIFRSAQVADADLKKIKAPQ